jgi:thiamine biosynthesis lipoprotein
MGCTAEVTVVGGHDDHLRSAEARLQALDALWSRFRPGSDVSRLNAADGAAVAVGPDTLTLLEALVAAWRATGGAFDPTLLPALVAAGDAVSRRDPTARSHAPPGARCPGDPAGIVVDHGRGTARLPRGTTIDAGGLGKGLGADLVVAELVAAGAEGALVSVGGDLRVTGRAPGAWAVAVEHPDATRRRLAVVDLAEGGVATSTPAARRWTGHDGRWRHHLLDPATAAPSTAPVASVTVAAGTAAWAEAFTKVPYALGTRDGLAALDAAGLAALIVTEDGTTHASAVWHALARPEGTP